MKWREKSEKQNEKDGCRNDACLFTAYIVWWSKQCRDCDVCGYGRRSNN
jgi:hypothetical protein